MAAQKTKKRRKKKHILRKLVLLVLLVFVCFAVAAFTPYFNINEIRIEGNQKVETQLVQEASGLDTGVNLFRIKLSTVQKNIAKIPYINSVQVKREFPDGIAIRVTESEPIACVPFLDGAVLIDKNGKALEKVTMDKTSNYLAIMGSEMVNFEPGEKIIVENQKKLQIILATVAEIVHNNLMGTVVEINVEDTSSIEYKLTGGRLTVLMGASDELAYKTRFLKQILSELGDNPKGVVDLTAKDPTYRLK